MPYSSSVGIGERVVSGFSLLGVLSLLVALTLPETFGLPVELWRPELPSLECLKEYYEIFSYSHLNRLLSQINIVPKTNLFPKYHISKHYRTRVKCHKMLY